MNGIDLQSGIAGALIPILLGLVIYFLKKDRSDKEKTLGTILHRLDQNKDKESSLMNEISGLKSEIKVFGSSYEIVASAAEKIILLKGALDAAFRKIDELKESIDQLQALKNMIELLDLSNEETSRSVLSRLYLLKRAVEKIGGIVDNGEWMDPDKIQELKTGDQ